MTFDDSDTKADTKEADFPPPPPPPYAPPRPPPSGYRIPLGPAAPFPSPSYTKAPACHDADGTPVFLGSAIFDNSVHPCKIGPCLRPPCRVPFGGSEVEHQGRYDLLPFDSDTMEWVPTSLGRIPAGHLPVHGGYEENGARLYHALASVQGVRVPGKTGEHLGGCNVAYGNVEHVITRGYDILCWKTFVQHS